MGLLWDCLLIGWELPKEIVGITEELQSDKVAKMTKVNGKEGNFYFLEPENGYLIRIVIDIRAGNCLNEVMLYSQVFTCLNI